MVSSVLPSAAYTYVVCAGGTTSQVTRHAVDEVGAGLGAEAADGGQRVGHGGDDDSGDEAGAEEGGEAAGGGEGALHHHTKVGHKPLYGGSKVRKRADDVGLPSPAG